MKCSVVFPGAPQSLLAATVAVCLIAFAPPAQAQGPDHAASANDDSSRELMDRGFTALKGDDLDGARAAFSQVWQRRPHVVVGMSLAEVEMRLGLFADAAEHWQYVVLNLPPTMSSERDSARKQLEICRSHVGAVTVQVIPDGSSVFVDDKPVGESPLSRELFLGAGAHAVYATRDGRRSIGHAFQVSAGGRLSFTLAVPVAGATATPTREASKLASVPAATRGASRSATTPEHGRSGLRMPLIVAGAATALTAAALGTYFAVKSNNASDDAASASREVEAEGDPAVPKFSRCAGANRPAACARLANDLVDADGFRNLSVGAFIGSGALAVGTLATMVLWKEGSTSRAIGQNSAQVTISPLLGSLRGLAVSGRF